MPAAASPRSSTRTCVVRLSEDARHARDAPCAVARSDQMTHQRARFSILEMKALSRATPRRVPKCFGARLPGRGVGQRPPVPSGASLSLPAVAHQLLIEFLQTLAGRVNSGVRLGQPAATERALSPVSAPASHRHEGAKLPNRRTCSMSLCSSGVESCGISGPHRASFCRLPAQQRSQTPPASTDGVEAAGGLGAEGVGESGWAAAEGEVGVHRGDHPDQRRGAVGADVQLAAVVVDGLDDAHVRPSKRPLKHRR